MPETFDAIKGLARKIFGGKQQGEQTAGVGLQRPVTREMEAYDKEALRFDRRTKITDCTKMAAVDARVSRMLEKLPGDAMVGGLTVRVESAMTDAVKDEAQQAIDSLLERCKVAELAEGWITALLREGDLFWENVVDEATREIVRLKKLAAIITYSAMNSEGNFPKDKPAYYQEHPWTRQKIKEFEAWQITHIKWRGEDGKIYGEPLFSAARLAYQRLDSGERNVVIRRGVRAGKRLHHSVGSQDRPSNWEGVKRYKDENKDTLANPMSPVQDYFSDGRVTITEVGGDSTLGEMKDIEHFEGLLYMKAGTPPALLGGGREEKVNRDILKEMEEDYFKVVANINKALERGLRKVINFQLLLSGINDESIKYKMNWGAKDRDDTDKKIERAIKLQSLGYSFPTTFGVCDLDEIDLEEEIERIRQQVEDGVIPYGLGMKLDPNVLMVLGAMAGGGPEGAKAEQLVEMISRLRVVTEQYMNMEGGDQNAGALTMMQMLERSKKIKHGQ